MDIIVGDNVGSEFGRFINVCFTVIACLIYCYFISKNIPKGFLRLISILPIISIFTLLPLNLSSIHLTFFIGYLVAWLANFKLLLFSFEMGPLSSSVDPHSSSSSMSLQLFIFLACLPLSIKQNPSSPHAQQNGGTKFVEIQKFSQMVQSIKPPAKSSIYYVIECLLLAMLLRVYEYKQHLHFSSEMMKQFYLLQTFFTLELLSATGTVLVEMLFELEVEQPQFDHPLVCSTSPQNFWGRRWNLVSSRILRSTVYEPVRHICSKSILGEGLGLYVAIVATFVVSGIMHELLFFYLGRTQPVWDVMWFFFLSGICLAMEIAVKKALKGRWQLNRFVSGPLSLGFLLVTSFWLLWPIFERIGVDVKVNHDIATLSQFVKGVVDHHQLNWLARVRLVGASL